MLTTAECYFLVAYLSAVNVLIWGRMFIRLRQIKRGQ